MKLPIAHPLWLKVNGLLKEYGVVDDINWRQALIGWCKGTLNPAIYKVWHAIRAFVIAEIWESRNCIMGELGEWIVLGGRQGSY